MLDRRFETPAPNRKRVADFTYVWTRRGLTLCGSRARSVFSRRVAGWSMSATMTAELVTDALGDGDLAPWPAARAAAPFRSRQLVHERGVPAVDGRARGDVQLEPLRKRLDDAAMESFFASLKVERVARKIYRTRDQATADVFDYIERFYSPRRRHSTIGYLSPMQFEQRMRLA